jgi:hypothetical protein
MTVATPSHSLPHPLRPDCHDAALKMTPSARPVSAGSCDAITGLPWELQKTSALLFSSLLPAFSATSHRPLSPSNLHIVDNLASLSAVFEASLQATTSSSASPASTSLQDDAYQGPPVRRWRLCRGFGHWPSGKLTPPSSGTAYFTSVPTYVKINGSTHDGSCSTAQTYTMFGLSTCTFACTRQRQTRSLDIKLSWH